MKFVTRASRLSTWIPALVIAAGCALAATASAANDPLTLGTPGSSKPGQASSNGEILVVDPAKLNCLQNTTFDDIAGGAGSGTNYDGVMISIGVSFAERFAGQTVSFSGDFDVISGNPTNPLTLQAGAPGQNLNVFAFTDNVLTGLGPLGFPNDNAIGEGAVAMHFTQNQSQLSFQLVGGDGGSATLSFYRVDGSLIDSIVLTGLANTTYGFKRLNDVADIAGVLIQNDDGFGIGVDNVCHDVAVVPVESRTWSGIKNIYR